MTATEQQVDAVTHPSGWWKASDGCWYPPEDSPRDTSIASTDACIALNLAVAAIVVGSFLPWTRTLLTTVHGTDGHGNVTLLLGGSAGALITRWWINGRVHRSLLTASLVLCAAASALLLYDVAHLSLASGTQTSAAHPQGGIFVTTFGALAATALTMVLRKRMRWSV